MIAIRIIATPQNVAKLADTPGVLARIAQTMQLDMIKVQANVVGQQIPNFFPNGAPNIAATVRAEKVEVEGSKVKGFVDAGGPRTTKITLKSGAEVDYAAVQHAGVPHSYTIEAIRARALHFVWNEKEVFFKHVTHPGLRARPYMTEGLKAMQDAIVADFQATIGEIIA